MEVKRIDPADMTDDLYLGYKGETDILKIIFDITSWQKLYGTGIMELFVTRPDGTQYFANIEKSENDFVWTIKKEDTSAAGSGSAQLTYFGEGKKKGKVYNTWIENSMKTTENVPPVWPEKVMEAGVEAKKSAEEANTAAIIAKSYTSGGTGIRTNEETDNAKYYYLKTKDLAEKIQEMVKNENNNNR